MTQSSQTLIKDWRRDIAQLAQPMVGNRRGKRYWLWR
jgi:hypothetical protein